MRVRVERARERDAADGRPAQHGPRAGDGGPRAPRRVRRLGEVHGERRVDEGDGPLDGPAGLQLEAHALPPEPLDEAEQLHRGGPPEWDCRLKQCFGNIRLLC